jgi:hypothetical protein
VRNQIKDSIGEMIRIYYTESFNGSPGKIDNSYTVFCNDYIVDEVLNVWSLQTYNVCNFDEDYNWRVEMHTDMFNGMASILEEISIKEQQQQQQFTDLLPLSNDVGQWDIIYADGLVYEYTEYNTMPPVEEGDDGGSIPSVDTSCPSLSYYASKESADDDLAYLL